MTSSHDSSSEPLSPDVPSLPPPGRSAATLRQLALLGLGAICLITAWGLRGPASYALLTQTPLDLGSLDRARLPSDVGVSGNWVRGHGLVKRDGIAFERRGQPGSFVLGRTLGRDELWVLLPVPPGTHDYVPPHSFEGRLVARRTMGLSLGPVARVMDEAGAQGGDFLLIEGATPRSLRSDLVLFALLFIVGTLALARVVLLALPQRAP